MLLTEIPNYIVKLYSPGDDWMYITNRHQPYIPAIRGSGMSLLEDYTSQLRTARHFPVLSSKLFKKALGEYAFNFKNDLKFCASPEVSFIIGHRGQDKFENLNLVLKTVAGQSCQSIECIVVEQSDRAELSDRLPPWVRYYHLKVDGSALYNRSLSFNYGVQKSSGRFLVLHDNDLLIPSCYTGQHLEHFYSGYDLVNLKRYIFGLNQTDSRALCAHGAIDMSSKPDYILQNAKGGGSLAISKQAYQKIGGYDNRFQGWGGEDNELWQRAQILNIYPYANLPLIHLWHTPQIDKRAGKHGGGMHTEQLADELSQISIYNRINKLTAKHTC